MPGNWVVSGAPTGSNPFPLLPYYGRLGIPNDVPLASSISNTFGLPMWSGDYQQLIGTSPSTQKISAIYHGLLASMRTAGNAVSAGRAERCRQCEVRPSGALRSATGVRMIRSTFLPHFVLALAETPGAHGAWLKFPPPAKSRNRANLPRDLRTDPRLPSRVRPSRSRGLRFQPKAPKTFPSGCWGNSGS